MNWTLAICAFLLCFIPFFPLYRYFWRVIKQNRAEFAPGFNKDFRQDLGSALMSDRETTANHVAEAYLFARIAVFIVPLIPHCMVSVGMYFLLRWLLV